MDLGKVGLFISTSRKEKGLTQKEMADMIGVTDKAVSKWETGRGFPDVSVLNSLSEVLEASISEIINGEAIPPESIEEKADNALVEALTYSKNMSRKSIGITMLVFGIVLIVFPPFLVTGGYSPVLFAFGAALLLCGIALVFLKKPTFKAYKNHLSKRFAGAITIVLLAVILFLQSVPHGVVLVFSAGPETRIRQTYAYFSLTPFGYASFFPLITAVLSVVIAVLTVISFISNYSFKRVQNSAFICTIIALVTSILSWIMFGTQYITGIGVTITILILLSLLPQSFSNRNSER